MNEQHQETYLNLIQTLLNYPNDQEGSILAANRELLDADFVKTVEAEAKCYAQQGEKNTVNRLRGLSLSPQAREEKDLLAYKKFLLKVLSTTDDSNGNPEALYPILTENTDKLDDTFAQVLQQWTTEKLAEMEADVATSLAIIIFEFSSLILKFPLGSKASNIEIAIAGYEIAENIFTPTTFPQEWATTQNNLGIAYSDRIAGDQAENLELSINAYNQALTVRTPKAFPQDWAMTQNNLGNAYSERKVGDPADNLELSIHAYNQALTVYTRDDFPQEWAKTQNYLGNAYTIRIVGDKAENLELAIHAYNQALIVRTPKAFPQDWAMTQYNLGIAYSKAEKLELAIDAFNQALTVYTRENFSQEWAMTQNNLAAAYSKRIVGNIANNLELSIQAYNQALTVYNCEDFPEDWAMTQYNLGTAYSKRILGDRSENLELAIDAFKQALTVYRHENFPEDWAATQNNLAAVYSDRIMGDKTVNLELAIHTFKQALTVYSREDFPQDWAMTQNNLAAAYSDRRVGDKTINVELAIDAFKQALTVYTPNAYPRKCAATLNNLAAICKNRTAGNKADNLELAIKVLNLVLIAITREAFPQDWAQTQYNLAGAYYERIVGDKAENLELAIDAFNQALTVHTREAFPQEHTKILFGLGLTYWKAKYLQDAYNIFKDAIDTVDYLRGEIVSGDEAKQKLAEEWDKVYQNMVQVCLILGKHKEAIEYIERNKTRILSELLTNRQIFPDGKLPEAVRQQLQQLRSEIDDEKRRLAIDKQPNYTRINQLRQRYNQLYPLKPIQFEEIQKLIDEDTVIIQWYLFANCLRAFIITPNQDKPIIWESDNEALKRLYKLTDEYLQDYYKDKEKWKNQLTEKLKELGEILHIDEIISLLPGKYQKIIFVPHLFLHLLPLHAFQLDSGEYLIDKFTVGYAPSCNLLQQVQKRNRPNFESIFAIQNPTEDLIYTDLEVEVIKSYFQSANVLKKSQATLPAINNANLNVFDCAHFSCHGYFNFTNPRKSALILANALVTTASTQPNRERDLEVREDETHDLQKYLTLDAIFSLELEQCRLVTLCACETGLVDFKNISDEYIGLPSGFLVAGSKAVVSSLWKVDDVSTALLMIRFYQNLKAGLTVVVALNQAQNWLRDATKAELQEWASKLKLAPKQAQNIEESLDWFDLNEKPFHNPYWWAGFCAIGQ
jgi:CHAT domain-containing protein/tetratricopeptide (TPR) repeat protein